MVTIGMPVLCCQGRRIGSVAQVLNDEPGIPPGLVITMPILFGLRRRRVTLTTFDVRDVHDGTVLLRISRWDVNNRASQTSCNAVRRLRGDRSHKQRRPGRCSVAWSWLQGYNQLVTGHGPSGQHDTARSFGRRDEDAGRTRNAAMHDPSFTDPLTRWGGQPGDGDRRESPG